MSRKKRLKAASKKAAPQPAPRPLLLPECPDEHVAEMLVWEARILENPADDLPRLVFADRLEELRHPDLLPRAELIRVGVQLAKDVPDAYPPCIEHHVQHALSQGAQDERTELRPTPSSLPAHPWLEQPHLKALAEREHELLKEVVRLGGYLTPNPKINKWREGWEVHSHLGAAFVPRNVRESTPAVLNVRGFPGVLWSPVGEYVAPPGAHFPHTCQRWEVPEFEPVACRFRADAFAHRFEAAGEPPAGWEPPDGTAAWWGFVIHRGEVGERHWEPFMLPPRLLAAVAEAVGEFDGDARWWGVARLGMVLRLAEYQWSDGSQLTLDPRPGEVPRLRHPVAAVLFPTRARARQALSLAMGKALSEVGAGTWWSWLAPNLGGSYALGLPERTRRAACSMTDLWADTARGGEFFPAAVIAPEDVAGILNPYGLTGAPDVDPVVTFHAPEMYEGEFTPGSYDDDGDDEYAGDGEPLPPPVLDDDPARHMAARASGYVESSRDMDEGDDDGD